MAELVGEAVSLPAEEREAFVRSAAAGDAAAQEEALSLLAALGGGGFLQHSTVPPAALAGDDRAPLASEGPGATIGNYRILQQIGEGGFGVVFMAEQREPVRRMVALKVIKLGMDTRAVVARFEAERQALAIMEHPNIARVFDAGSTASGRPYFVMELVRGDPIVDYCNSENLTARERLDLFLDVCRAVQHAHTKGIIHRDLKPGNVLVTVLDGKPVPKVIDFGIAKATVAAARLTDKTLFTEFRQVIGTLAYMSPEQADNAAADVDTRSDVYSLGVILYELLTGVTPFDPERLRSAAFGEMQRIIREEDPPKPSTRLSTLAQGPGRAGKRSEESTRRASEVRGDLDWIVMRCLEKDRSRRYQTAEALAADLERAIAGQPVLAAPPSAAYRLRKMLRRNRGAAITGAMVFTALVLGVVGTSLGLLQARRDRDHARLERSYAESTAQFLQTTLAAVGPSVALGRDTEMLREIMDAAAARIERGDLADNRRAEISLRRTIGTTYASIAKFDGAEVMLTRALALARETPGTPPAELARCLHELAGLRSAYQRRFAEAEPLYREELAVLRSVHRGDDREVALAIGGIAGCLEGMDKPALAEPLHLEALAMQRRLATDADGRVRDNDELSMAIHNLAGVMEALDRPREAEVLYRESVEMHRRLHKGDHPMTALGLNNLAGVLDTLGRAEAAAPLYQESLDMRRRLHKGDHPDVLVSLNNLAYSLRARGKRAEAEPVLRESLAMARRLYPGDHAFVAGSLDNLAALLQNLDRPGDAEPLVVEALEMHRRLNPGDSADVATCLVSLGNILASMDRPAEAEARFREALAIRLRLTGPDHRDTVAAQTPLAMLLSKTGRAAEAEPIFRSATAALEKTFKGDHPRIANLLSQTALCVDRLGRRAEALDLARRGAEMAVRVIPEGHATRIRCEQIYEQLKGPPKQASPPEPAR